MRSIMNKNRSRLGWIMLIVGVLLNAQKEPAFAQVKPDGSLPSKSQVNQHGKIYNITGGTKAGNNLFHSFEKFGVPDGGEAYFNNAVEIQNIINRVTGKSISEINGLIRAKGTANLFLINPNGIVFGENAKLDIGGSFIGSTADSFNFNDGKEFSAINPEEKPLLSINIPLGLQYGKNPVNINNSGILSVKTGNNITLISNRFENTGKLKADGGQISIAAIGKEGFASLGKSGELLNLIQPDNIIDSNYTNIETIINKGNIDASIQMGIGGKIVVLGAKIGLLENSLLNVSGSAGGGEITVGNYDTIASYTDPKASLQSNALITGDGGKITVSATESTRAHGSFSAKGGLSNGNGGLIETSGSNFLDITGITVDTNANNGLNGNWLVNSDNIFFGTGDSFNRTSNSNNSAIFQPAQNKTVLDISTVEKQLSAGNNVKITANQTGNEAGNIKADQKIEIEATNNIPVTLTLQADNDITLSEGDIQSRNNRLGMVLQADSDGNGKGKIRLGNDNKESFIVNTKGEKFTASADSILLSGADILSNNTEGKDSEEIAMATTGSVLVKDSGIVKNTDGLGKSSDINIKANGSVVVKGSGIIQKTNGVGNSGDINIKADSLFIQGGIDNTTTDNSTGNAGNINVKVNSLSITIGAISSFTEGNGNSGRIKIEAHTLDIDKGIIQNYTKKNGNGGDIIVNVNSVSLQKGGFRIITQGNGNAGKLILNAVNKIFIGKGGTLNGDSDSNEQGNASEITLNTGSLVLENYATIAANAKNPNSQANAGNININADSILLTNNSTIASNTSGKGNAGEIRLQADIIKFKNSNNIVANAENNSTGNAGKIIVEARSILFENELEFIDENPNIINSLSTIAKGNGNGGEVTITAEEIIFRNKGGIGIDPKSLQGNAGKLTINTSLLQLENSQVKDNAGINSSSTGFGKGGELIINADKILLDKSDIEAQTESEKGGNIILNLKELLLLRNGSRISTTAGKRGGSGDGGNIEINAPDGFVVAIPNENTDITANAFEGEGGNINIISSGIFGIKFRELTSQTSDNDTNDISASSELGIDGTVEINTPDINPSNELAELPSIPIYSKLAKGCYNPGYAQNQFFIVGRGGLPPLPQDFLTPSAVRVEWINPQLNNDNSSFNQDIEVKSNTEKPKRIVEATGWITNDKGEIIFTADAPVVTTDNSMQQAQNCEF